MVDKADCSELIEPRQAGDELMREVERLWNSWDCCLESLPRPPGLTVEMLDRAEDLILDWHVSGVPRGAPLVVVLYKMLTTATGG